MEVNPDFDAGEVARTVALAVSNLHNRNLSSDSGNDETPLVGNKGNMSLNSSMDPEDKTNLVPSKRAKWRDYLRDIPARHVLTILGFLGVANVYALRVNLSVAMVAMVNNTVNKTVVYECDAGNTNSSSNDVVKEGEFNWSPNTQGTILGSFFYGYLITQIPGGRMAEVFGGKWLFGLGVLCTSILTLLTPVAARWGVTPLIVLRVCEGLGEGVTYPAMHAMLGSWLPKLERSLLGTIIYSGAQIGTVIAMPLSGILCDSDLFGGWPSVFYVFGTLGCLWFISWCILIYETPDCHPRISKAELLLIQAGRSEDEKNKKKRPIPWKRILTSVPVWALTITHFGQNWGFYTFLTELPTYLSSILHFNIKSDGFISALPYLLQAIVGWASSYAADTARQKQYLTISTIRKICNTIGFLGPALCLLGVIFVGCNHVWSVIFLTLAMGFNGFTFSGYMVTHVDMAPEFAGTLMGITNAFATLTGFLAPKAVGALTENNQTLSQWRIVFYIAIAVYIVTGALYVVCGSAKLQKWGTTKSRSLEDVSPKKEENSDINE